MSPLYTTSADIVADKSLRWVKVCLDFEHWEHIYNSTNLFSNTWTEVQFNASNLTSIPQSQGIYMFIVRPNHEQIFNSNMRVVMYVGRSNNLHRRYSEYLRYSTSTHPSDLRKKIMTVVWERYLHYAYIEMPLLSKADLDRIEYDLIDSITPPINDDFRANAIKERIKAYR